ARGWEQIPRRRSRFPWVGRTGPPPQKTELAQQPKQTDEFSFSQTPPVFSGCGTFSCPLKPRKSCRKTANAPKKHRLRTKLRGFSQKSLVFQVLPVDDQGLS